MSVIIASDLHIKKKPGMWAGRAEISGDDLFALDQIVDLCNEVGHKLYLLGDVLDCVTNAPRPIAELKDRLSKLKNKPVRYIQGQHEMFVQATYTQHPWLSVIEGTEHLHGKQFDFLGKKAYALDYFPQVLEGEVLATVPPETEVLFLHGTIDIVMPAGFHISSALLPESVKYVFAGDWHEAAEVKLPNGGRLYYPGSTYLCSVSEPLDKHVLLVDRDGEDLKVDTIRLKTRPIVKISKMDSDEIEVDSELPKEVSKPVVLVDEPTDQTRLVQLAAKYHIYSMSSSNAVTQEYCAAAQDESISDAEILAAYVDQKNNRDEFDFILDVIMNPVNDALERLRTKLGVTLEKDEDTPKNTTEKVII